MKDKDEKTIHRIDGALAFDHFCEIEKCLGDGDLLEEMQSNGFWIGETWYDYPPQFESIQEAKEFWKHAQVCEEFCELVSCLFETMTIAGEKYELELGEHLDEDFPSYHYIYHGKEGGTFCAECCIPLSCYDLYLYPSDWFIGRVRGIVNAKDRRLDEDLEEELHKKLEEEELEEEELEEGGPQ